MLLSAGLAREEKPEIHHPNQISSPRLKYQRDPFSQANFPTRFLLVRFFLKEKTSQFHILQPLGVGQGMIERKWEYLVPKMTLAGKVGWGQVSERTFIGKVGWSRESEQMTTSKVVLR